MREQEIRETRFLRINRCWLVVHLVASAAVGILSMIRRDWYATSQAALAIGMLPLVHLLFWILRRRAPFLRLTGDVTLLYRVFVFGTITIGSACYGYAYIPYWDKIFHFISGALFAAAGLMAWRLLTPNRTPPHADQIPLMLVFSQLFNLSVAVVWEFYEYGILVIFGFDAVNHTTTGVHDTMQDMLVCALGGLVLLVQALHYYYRRKRSFLMNVVTLFFYGGKEGEKEDLE